MIIVNYVCAGVAKSVIKKWNNTYGVHFVIT